MHESAIAILPRRPRFRRASKQIPFRLTDGDLKIMRAIERHRFVRSTHIAALVGRSLDRTNDRLCRLFHAGYIDRPKAQLDYYPTAGSAPMVYALADRGARLLTESGFDCANVPISRNNETGSRPFIEHQLEIVGFSVALELAARQHRGIRLIHANELIRGFPEQTRVKRNPFALRATIADEGGTQEIGIVPDLAFGIGFRDGSRRCFMVEIDRGTMPVTRSDMSQTSFERKMRGYLSAYAAGEHERQFGWKAFRVLTVTMDDQRLSSMMKALGSLSVPQSPGPCLFWFGLRQELNRSNPIEFAWRDGAGQMIRRIV
jgi:Replication-relaxation